MSAHRSSGGCWSCKVRHKKCDQVRPTCNVCIEAHVHCHGYGPQPAWLDRGPRQYDELARLNQEAKKARRAARAQAQDQGKTVRRTSTPMQNQSQNLSKPRPVKQAQSTESSDSFISLDTARDKEPFAPSNGATATPNRSVHSYEEAGLMLYYLDIVIPLQFPYCSENYRRKSRTLIFWLLTRNEPLKSAALSLSALHYSASSSKPAESSLNTRALNTLTFSTLTRQYTRALQRLQEWLLGELAGNDDHTDESLVELLAVSVFLVSFEAFRSAENESVQARFNAVITTVQMMEPAMSAFSSKDGNWITDAVIFLTGVVIWFDILSSMSFHTDPKTPYKALLRIPSIDMAELMGCQNWVLDIIGDLTRIGGVLKTNDTEASAEARKEIESAHMQLETGLKQIQSQQEITPRVSAVTQIFAYSALVELYALTSGPLSRLPQIHNAVRKVMAALQTFPAQESVSGLAWPICAAGSMAHPSHQKTFEEFISRGIQDSQREFGNCVTVLSILKTCWEERKQDPMKAWGWRETMQSMGCSVLLI